MFDLSEDQIKFYGTFLLGIPVLAYFVIDERAIGLTIGLAITALLVYKLEDLSRIGVAGFGLSLTLALTFYDLPILWIIPIVYGAVGFYMLRNGHSGGSMRLFGKSEWDKNREHELAMADKQHTHERGMQRGDHDHEYNLTWKSIDSNERIAGMQVQGQKEVAHIQAYAQVQTARYNAIGNTRIAEYEYLEAQSQQAHEAALAGLDADLKRDIAYDSNKANVTISLNKLEAETIRIREKMEADVRLLQEQQKLLQGEKLWQNQFDQERLEAEIDAHYRIMEKLDEEERSAFMRRWYGRNQHQA